MSDIQENKFLIEIAGGDLRVADLIHIAATAYGWIPPNLIDIKTGVFVQDRIQKAIEAFGVTCAPIPFHRMAKRFHKNRPTLQIFKKQMSKAEVEEHMSGLVAANCDEPVRKSRKKAVATK
jgi:hypothetical protein